MSETSVENQICQTCGADARPNTLFCYNCGGAVKLEAETILNDKENVSESTLRENRADGVNGDSAKHTTQLENAGDAEEAFNKPAVQADVQLKSAASMRRKSKIVQPKRVEVIWEEHENAPNGWFILVAVILTIFAAVILYLALLLK